MAKIHEEIIVIKFSKLVKDSDAGLTVTNEDLISNLEAVAQELAGSSIIVEIEKAQ